MVIRLFAAKFLPMILCALPAAAQSVSIPFVGCPADGQIGPREAPKRASIVTMASRHEAERLAYYRGPDGNGVLAPRGWHCVELYGSSGSALYVSPSPAELPSISASGWKGVSGAAILAQRRYGGTSGRFAVAEVIAMVFPARKQFVREVIEMFDEGESRFRSGPHPTDKLTYRGETIVEYVTPAGMEGLGTQFWLRKSDSPIQGVAILVGETPDLLHLAVRLPADLAELTPVIIRQFEGEAVQAR